MEHSGYNVSNCYKLDSCKHHVTYLHSLVCVLLSVVFRKKTGHNATVVEIRIVASIFMMFALRRAIRNDINMRDLFCGLLFDCLQFFKVFVGQQRCTIIR
jgi:hypothetical protein